MRGVTTEKLGFNSPALGVICDALGSVHHVRFDAQGLQISIHSALGSFAKGKQRVSLGHDAGT